MNQASQMIDIRRDLVALLPRLRRFALTLTSTAAEADSLVGQAAQRAIQKSYHWKGEGRIENWLFSLIRTTWGDELKKQRRRGEQDAAQHEPDPTRSASRTVLDLPEGLSSALLLVDVEGFSYAEAATILGISADVLADRLCAARLSLAADTAHGAERRA